jgi:hypothetical protein
VGCGGAPKSAELFCEKRAESTLHDLAARMSYLSVEEAHEGATV